MGCQQEDEFLLLMKFKSSDVCVTLCNRDIKKELHLCEHRSDAASKQELRFSLVNVH